MIEKVVNQKKVNLPSDSDNQSEFSFWFGIVVTSNLGFSSESELFGFSLLVFSDVGFSLLEDGTSFLDSSL